MSCFLLLSLIIFNHQCWSTPKYEYLHYDLILSGFDPSNAMIEEHLLTLTRSSLKEFQYSLISLRNLEPFVNNFRKRRTHYGRTILDLNPKNITELHAYMQQLKKLYAQPRNYVYLDSRLITFIRWQNERNSSESDRRKMMRQFAKYFALNCEVYVWFTENESNRFYEIYSLKNNTFVNLVPSPKVTKCPFPGLVDRRKNLEGLTLIFSALHNGEHCNTLHTSQESDEENVSFEINHSCNQILADYQRLLNFSIAAKPSSYIWLEHLNGTLGGMGKLLQTGEVDVAISATYLLDYRVKYLTALTPVGNEPILVYFIQPQPSTVTDIYNLQFSTSVWKAVYFTVFAIFLTSVIFALFGHPVHNDEQWWSSSNLIWIICNAGQMGWHSTPRYVSGKILLLTTGLFSYTTYAAYSGAMIGGLAYELVPVSDVPGLVEHGFKFIYDPNVYNPFFKSGKSSDWLADILKVHKEPFVGDTQAVQAVIDKKVALLTTTRNFIAAYYTSHQNDSYMCETLHKISLSKRFMLSSFFVAKGSPLKELLNSRLLILLENGLKHRYWTYYYQRNNSVKCSEKEFSYRADLGINDIASAYLILIGGFGLSLISFLAERKINSVKKYLAFQKAHYYWSDHVVF